MTGEELIEILDDVDIPKPHMVPTPKGIEFNWSIGNRYLQLIVPMEDEAYLFFKDCNDYGIEGSGKFAERLVWLTRVEDVQIFEKE